MNPQIASIVDALKRIKTPDAAHLFLLHSLEHFFSDDALEVAINHSLELALKFPFWRSNFSELSHALLKVTDDMPDFDLSENLSSTIHESAEWQFFEIQNSKDFYQIANQNLKFETHAKCRILPDSTSRMIGLLLDPSGGLEIQAFCRFAYISKGKLKLISDGTKSVYTPDLTPSAKTHFIALNENSITKIHLGDLSYYQTFKGYLLTPQSRKDIEQKNPFSDSSGVDGSGVVVVSAFKKLERFFIDRRTDPYYQSLIGNIEKATSALQSETIHRAQATAIYEYSRKIYEDIFPDDKLIVLLLKGLSSELERSWKNEQERKNQQISRPVRGGQSPQV